MGHLTARILKTRYVALRIVSAMAEDVESFKVRVTAARPGKHIKGRLGTLEGEI